MPKYANILKSTALTLIGLMTAATASAGEAQVPVSNFGPFEHVFLIMMENETNTPLPGQQEGLRPLRTQSEVLPACGGAENSARPRQICDAAINSTATTCSEN